jgi:hypothetical protein
MYILVLFWAVTWLAGLSRQEPGFSPKPAHVGSVVDQEHWNIIYADYLGFPYPYRSTKVLCSLVCHHQCVVSTTDIIIK